MGESQKLCAEYKKVVTKENILHGCTYRKSKNRLNKHMMTEKKQFHLERGTSEFSELMVMLYFLFSDGCYTNVYNSQNSSK